MAETAEDARERERKAAAREWMAAAREAARRREAADQLRIASAVAGYAARQVADGLSPEQARLAALEAAGELAEVAAALRRLARLGPAERRDLAQLWAGQGTPSAEIARRLGVSGTTVWYYVRGRPHP